MAGVIGVTLAGPVSRRLIQMSRADGVQRTVLKTLPPDAGNSLAVLRLPFQVNLLAFSPRVTFDVQCSEDMSRLAVMGAAVMSGLIRMPSDMPGAMLPSVPAAADLVGQLDSDELLGVLGSHMTTINPVVDAAMIALG